MPKEGEYIREGYCHECQKEVDVVASDCGFGAYEYWGARGVDHDWQEVCDVCGSEMVDE